MSHNDSRPESKRNLAKVCLGFVALLLLFAVFFRGSLFRWLRIDPRIAGLEDVGYVGVSWDGVLNPQATYGVPDAMRVTRVVQGGPADQAGIQINDVIVGLNGSAFSSVHELQRLVGLMKPGDVLTLDVVRSGKRISFEMRLVRWDEIVDLSLKTPGDGISL